MSVTWVIARREANSILRQRRMLLFAVGFGVVIPLVAGAGVVGLVMRLSSYVEVTSLGHLHAALHVTGLQHLVQGMLVWLGIFPILFSAQFAAIAFASERERRSLPALLATPAPLGAMIAGKLLASLAPGWATVLASFGVYLAGVNAVAPEATAWLPADMVIGALLFLIALSLLVNGTALLISARSHTIAGASSTVTFVSLPASIATVVFATLMGVLGTVAVVGIALAIAGFAAIVLLLGTALWRREEILAN
ncbi:MAG TPA: ABC transporter permease subunit [Chloroflexota bacterium]|nr:ABC transporter permease subunit [Chloroflexota bacterium]